MVDFKLADIVSNEAVNILEGNKTVFKERGELYGII